MIVDTDSTANPLFSRHEAYVDDDGLGTAYWRYLWDPVHDDGWVFPSQYLTG